MTHGALCLHALERGAPGATREVGSAAANLGLAGQTAASACLVFGVLARKAVDHAAALTAATPPLGIARPGQPQPQSRVPKISTLGPKLPRFTSLNHLCSSTDNRVFNIPVGGKIPDHMFEDDVQWTKGRAVSTLHHTGECGCTLT